MSGFSLEWLSLREPADLIGRNTDLLHATIHWLQGIDMPIIVDLGAGSGSTLRALEQAGLRNGLWRLVDNDGLLLNEALGRHLGDWMLEDHQSDLTIVDELPLGGARLVTASALFDLASEQLLEQLISRLPGGCALYSALNYDGVMSWTPKHPLDTQVTAAFNQHQRRDKGMGGPALGPQAVAFLAPLLESKGFNVEVAESPWRLDAKHTILLRELIAGIVAAVSASPEYLTAVDLADWQAFREQHAATGTCYVGHLDILAIPAVS